VPSRIVALVGPTGPGAPTRSGDLMAPKQDDRPTLAVVIGTPNGLWTARAMRIAGITGQELQHSEPSPFYGTRPKGMSDEDWDEHKKGARNIAEQAVAPLIDAVTNALLDNSARVIVILDERALMSGKDVFPTVAHAKAWDDVVNYLARVQKRDGHTLFVCPANKRFEATL
jgi:hypothetical protein